jgi:tetratricopeptide (TPR) repeat protein/predicted Ser/Thr protein kinase
MMMPIPDEPDPPIPATERLAEPPRYPPTGVAPGPRAENEARLGLRVGPYKLQRLLGHGGMGAVYLATREDGEFEREVALKLIRFGLEDDAARRRFERERRILSRLEHPAIARLYDGGVDEDGAPWFAMERIEGENLSAWCAQQKLPLRERVRLIVAIGQAVQYAHQQLVIHRDLKPSNILVDARGAPHVLDFGIAAPLDEREGERTAPGTATHTPGYAAPEQIEGAPVSAATDVYTLGVMLFELLTGVRPFDDARASAFAIQRAALESPTPTLASKLPAVTGERERLAAERGLLPTQWQRSLRGDLDAILHRALERHPRDRYPSMAEFVEDLQRWLDGRPVAAARAGMLYRTRKFAQRHRLGLSVAAGIVLLLFAATLASLYQAHKAREEAERAEAVKQFLMSLFQQARPGTTEGDNPSARQLLDQGAQRLLHEMSDQPRISGQLLNTIGNAYAHLGDYTQAAVQLDSALEKLPAAGDTLRARFDVLVDLVDLYSHQGKIDEGERHATEGLAILERLRAADASPWRWFDPNTQLAPTYFGDAVQTLDSRAEDLDLARARLLDRRGEREQAITLRQRVADARDARPDEHPTRIRVAQNDLALALSEVGRNEEAITRFERLLRDNEREFGPNHSSSVRVRHNLALALRRVDRLDEAERIERDNAVLAARSLPPTHPMQAYIANTLAGILRHQRRFAEAQQWYAQARKVFEGQPEVDRDMLATIHYNESFNQLALFDLAGAQASLDAADAVWTAAYGAEHPRRRLLALQRAVVALQGRDVADALARVDAATRLIEGSASSDPRERIRLVLLRAQAERLAGSIDAARARLNENTALALAVEPPPLPADALAWRLLDAQLSLDAGDAARAAEVLAHIDATSSGDDAPNPDVHLLQARLSCARSDYPRCTAESTAADAASTHLGADTPPRRIARAWMQRALRCSRRESPISTSDVAALESAGVASADLAPLQAPCVAASP